MKMLILTFFTMSIFFVVHSQELISLGSITLGFSKAETIKATGLEVITINEDKDFKDELKTNDKVLKKIPNLLPNDESLRQTIYLIAKAQIANLFPWFGKDGSHMIGKPGFEPMIIRNVRIGNVEVKNLCLLFYNDRLAMIQPDATPELFQYLLNKVKSNNVLEESESVPCTSPISHNPEKGIRHTTTTKWETTVTLSAFTHVSYVTTTCEIRDAYKFIILDKPYKELIAPNN